MKLIAALCTAVAISTVGLMPSTYAETAVDEQAPLEVHAVGCLRAWKPAPQDVTKLPENREPGMSGMFVLTPLASGPTVAIELPAYLLTPSATVNFQQHLDRKVEVVGVVQNAPMPPTAQQIVNAPTQRPEEMPNVQSFPRLTVRTIKKLADSCPS